MNARVESTCGFAPCVCNQGCEHCDDCGSRTPGGDVYDGPNGERLCAECLDDEMTRAQGEPDYDCERADYAPDGQRRW